MPSLITVGLILFTPFILAFLGTFKTDAEIIAWPPTFLPTVWHVENWPRLWNTDVGGLPRPDGATSLGLSAGVFVFFVTFLVVGLSSEEVKTQGLPRCNRAAAGRWGWHWWLDGRSGLVPPCTPGEKT